MRSATGQRPLHILRPAKVLLHAAGQIGQLRKVAGGKRGRGVGAARMLLSSPSCGRLDHHLAAAGFKTENSS